MTVNQINSIYSCICWYAEIHVYQFWLSDSGVELDYYFLNVNKIIEGINFLEVGGKIIY